MNSKIIVCSRVTFKQSIECRILERSPLNNFSYQNFMRTYIHIRRAECECKSESIVHILMEEGQRNFGGREVYGGVPETINLSGSGDFHPSVSLLSCL